MFKRNAIIILGVGLLGGCTLAPKYERPAAPVAAGYPAAAEAKGGAAAELGWKEYFGDARLQALLSLALENNRDLRVAALNVEKVRALYRIQRTALIPSLDLGGDGMRKRVAIARALTLDPEYVLFDEPTTSLDPVSARRVDRLIRELSDKLGVTSIVVSHDLVSIFTIADRIVMLYKGKVRMLGTREDFQTTDDGIVDQFIHGRATGPMDL